MSLFWVVLNMTIGLLIIYWFISLTLSSSKGIQSNWYRLFLTGLNTFFNNFSYLVFVGSVILYISVIFVLLLLLILYNSYWVVVSWNLIYMLVNNYLSVTLFEGTIFIHPPLFYLGGGFTIIYFIGNWGVGNLQGLLARYDVLNLLLVLLFTSLTGGLWSLLLFNWNFFWVFDFIEWFPVYFCVLLLYKLHIRFFFNFVFLNKCIFFILGFLLLSLRFGFIKTSHSFFNSKSKSLLQWYMLFQLLFSLSFTEGLDLSSLHGAWGVLFFIQNFQPLNSGGIIVDPSFYLALISLSYFMLMLCWGFASTFSLKLYSIHFLFVVIWFLFYINTSNWITQMVVQVYCNSFTQVVYIYFWAFELFDLKLNEGVFSTFLDLKVLFLSCIECFYQASFTVYTFYEVFVDSFWFLLFILGWLFL